MCTFVIFFFSKTMTERGARKERKNMRENRIKKKRKRRVAILTMSEFDRTISPLLRE